MNCIQEIERDGFSLLKNVFSIEECQSLASRLEDAMRQDDEQFHVRQSRGTVFAARNILELMPQVSTDWRKRILVDSLESVLGSEFALVRVLYFDKPSDRSWSLPFHKDMTIAVQDNRLPTTHFSKPTNKAGVPHVEASEELLNNMLTLRIHLDNVTEDNGPLQVIPGSHLNGKTPSGSFHEPFMVLCDAGDVLAMRPLISHGSCHTNPDKNLHRRILHLEFTGMRVLPDRFDWHQLID